MEHIALPIRKAVGSGTVKPGLGSWLRRLLLTLSGQVGSSVLTLLALYASLSAFEAAGVWVYQPLVALLIIRIWYCNTRGPKPVLTLYKIRKRLWRTVVDEGKIGLVFLGICFVMSWPIPVLAAAVFFAANFVLQMSLMSLARFVIKMLAKHDELAGWSDTMAQKAIIVGTGENAQRVADLIFNSPEMDTRLVGFLDFQRQGFWRYRDVPLLGHPDSFKDMVAGSQIDALFWAVEPEDIACSKNLMETAEKMGVRVFVMPNLYHPKVARVRPSYISGMPTLVYRSEPESQLPLLLKSMIDRLGAAIGLILAAPLMLLTALIVKLDSRGPVFFKQTRSGLNGKPFGLYKFRTMCCDAEGRKNSLLEQNEMSGPVFKIKEDPRVTSVGRFLRKFSIDELPQLLNVLKGEMSLVGPRPPLPQEVRQFEPWQHRKLSVRPGLTCLWQVNGRNAVDFDEWMRLDLQYIDNWSLWLDAKILAKTFPAVMKGSGQ